MATVPIYNMTDTWNNGATVFTAIKMNVTNTASAAASLLMDLQVGGSSVFSVGPLSPAVVTTNVKSNIYGWEMISTAAATSGCQLLLKSNADVTPYFGLWQLDSSGNMVFRLIAGGPGDLYFDSAANGTTYFRAGAGFTQTMALGATTLTLQNGLRLGIDSGTGTGDVFLYRDAANTLAQRNSTTAQTLRVYNTFTDALNYERGIFDWGTNANILTIGTQNAGTGTARELRLISSKSGDASVGVICNGTRAFSCGDNSGSNGYAYVGPSAVGDGAPFQVNQGGTGLAFSALGQFRLSANRNSIVPLQLIDSAASGHTWNLGCSTSAGNFDLRDITAAGAPTVMTITAGSGNGIYAAQAGTGFTAQSNTGFFAIGATSDTFLYRDAANALAQRNSTTAQTLRVYNTYSGGGSNYERGVLDWATNANKLTIGTQAAGTGTLRDIEIVGGNVGVNMAPLQALDVSGNIQSTGVVLASSGATQFGTVSGLYGGMYGSGGLYLLYFSGVVKAALFYDNLGNIFLGDKINNPYTSISVPAANKLQLGMVDAATATAQTLQVQNVAAGNINTAGADFTIGGSQGTGTGAGGSIIFKTAPAGTTGTSQNALATALVIGSNNTIEQRNSTSAQTLRVYNTYTDASNYERVSLTWLTNVATIQTEVAGTGVARDLLFNSQNGNLYFQSSGSTIFYINGSGLRAVADNTYDIGNSNATRPRNAFLGGALATSPPTTQSGTTYSMGTSDSSIIANNASATLTLTLLAASSYFGRWLYVKTTQNQLVVSNASNVVPIGGGAASTAILAATAGKWAILQSDGTNWITMAAN